MILEKTCIKCGKLFEKSPSDSIKYWNQKRYCSISCSKKERPSWNKGLPRTWKSTGDFKVGSTPWNKGDGEYAKKLGFGKWMKDKKGPLANNWKGDDVGYEALHQWLRRERGMPMKCEQCGFESNNTYQIHWANKSGEYKRDLNDWIRLCAKCHKKYDKGRKQKKFER